MAPEHVRQQYANLSKSATSARDAIAGVLAAAARGDAADVAAHPDLAYLDLQLRGFYGDDDELLP